MYSSEENTILITIPWTKEIAIGMCTLNVISLLFNFLAVWYTYNRGKTRISSTSIIVANLACMEILVSIKDLPMIIDVIKGEQWIFQEQWCATYGFPNVIFIIVAVSTLIMLVMGLIMGYRDISESKPIVLAFVLTHMTLSYSLTLLWSKYVFVLRKSFCRVEWPSKSGSSIAFVSPIVFLLPFLVLIYNIIFKSMHEGSGNNNYANVKEIADGNEKKAQKLIHVASPIFLLSWVPYVIESIVSGFVQVNPLVGMVIAIIPLFTTSLVPYTFLRYSKLENKSSPNKELVSIIA